MELFELQELWQQTDKKISDNIQLNKEILRRMLISKPEKRINWMRNKAIFNLIMPLFFTIIVLIPHLEFRQTFDFYIGVSLFISILTISYVWAIKYYWLLRKIKFTDPILTIKKNVSTLGQFKIKITRKSFLLAPIAMIAGFLIFPFAIHPSNSSIMFFILFTIVAIVSVFFSYRNIIQQYQKLNDEVLEIEELERNS